MIDVSLSFTSQICFTLDGSCECEKYTLEVTEEDLKQFFSYAGDILCIERQGLLSDLLFLLNLLFTHLV